MSYCWRFVISSFHHRVYCDKLFIMTDIDYNDTQDAPYIKKKNKKNNKGLYFSCGV